MIALGPRVPYLAEFVATTRNQGARASASKAVQILRGKWYLRKTRSGAVRVRGKVNVANRGSIRIGDRVRLDGTLIPIELVANGGNLTIGDGTYVNYGTNISSTTEVRIGRDCLIGQYSIIMDDDYHALGDHTKPGRRAPVTIGDRVWLGARVIVLCGTQIGEGAVIGANSVVRGAIPPYTLAAGSPARVIRELRTDD